MRRASSTLVLLAVAIGFGAYLYFIDAKKPVPDANAKEKVFSVDASKVDRIEITPSAGDAIALAKDSSGWNMTAPVQTPADQYNAADIAASLASIEEDRVVDENAADLAPYGLASPRLDVAFGVEGESDLKRILIGETNPTGSGIYAKLPGNARVFLVSSALDQTLNRTAFDLRDKAVLKFETGKVDSIELASKNQTIRIVKDGDGWKMVAPIEAPADYAGVEGLIGQLQSAQMTSLKESPDDLKSLAPFGLDRPEVVARLGLGGATAVLQLGSAAEPGTLWARDPSKPSVFSIAAGVADELRQTPFDLRRKEIFDFRPFNATRFEIVRGKDTLAFERVKGATPEAPDTWKQVAPTDKTVDSGNLESALMEFSNLRATAAVDKAGPATGLGNPAATIAVTFDDGKKEERVTIGRAGGEVYATRSDQPGALKLDTATFDAATKTLESVQ